MYYFEERDMVIPENKYHEIDSHIIPLVEALNGVKGITTHFSCHGHYGRPNPWIIFSADDLFSPYILWKRLKDICRSQNSNRLKYFWTIKPWFRNYDGRLGFQMVGKPIGHYSFLSRRCLKEESDYLQKQIFLGNHENNKTDYYKDERNDRSISIDPNSARIFRIAAGTPLCIGGNTMPANVTFNELCHEVIYQLGRSKSNRGDEIIIMSSLHAGAYLWTLVDMLESLNFEDAFKRSPDVKGHFIEGESVLLRIS